MMALPSDILKSVLMPPNGILQIHSSFKRLAHQGFMAESFLDDIICYLDGGTLLLPTMTWRTITPDNNLFDVATTPSHTGVLSEIFRINFAQHRSLHPTHSVAGLGPSAQHLLSTHHLGTTPCHSGSPYGRMRGSNAYVLLLGVGLECCTAIHHCEETIAPDAFLHPAEKAETYRLRDWDGSIYDMKLRRHLRLDRNFPLLEPALHKSGALRSGTFCGTSWLFFSVNILYELAEAALRRSVDALIGKGHPTDDA